MREFELIASIQEILNQKFGSGIVGPGDDAAYLDASIFRGRGLLFSSDMLVEGVHFRSDWSSIKDIAWKALAVNESDIAAMGGDPAGFLVSVGVPESKHEVVLELYRGFKDYLTIRKLGIFGGDIVRTSVLTISVHVFGYAGTPVLRSGARVGDTVYLSREIGWAGMGLRVLQGLQGVPEDVKQKALEAHRRPVPETALGRMLSDRRIATSMIDVSDGLLQDAMHICHSSKVDLLLFENHLPLCDYSGLSRQDFFNGLISGDDYALLFTSTLPPDEMKHVDLPSPVLPIGKVISAQGDEMIHFLSSDTDTGKPETSTKFLARNGMDPKKPGYSH